MATEGFGGVSRIAATLSAATPILMCAVATAISFRAGVFNVGVEGGFYVGGLAGAVVGFTLTALPSPVLIVAELRGGRCVRRGLDGAARFSAGAARVSTKSSPP